MRTPAAPSTRCFWALFVACLFALVSSTTARDARADDTVTKRYYVVTAAYSDREDADAQPLLVRVDDSIMLGLNMAADTRHFGRAFSVRRMTADQRKTIVPALITLESYTGHDLLRALDQAKMLPDRVAGKEVRIVQVAPRHTADGMRVTLELYDTNLSLKKMKSVGGCGESDDVVLDQLQLAARSLVFEKEETDPRSKKLKNGAAKQDDASASVPFQPVITVTPAAPLTLGKTITVDACRSVDPDYDALTYEWTQVGAVEGGAKSESNASVKAGARVFSTPKFEGRRFSFVPQQEGIYDFSLTIKKAIDGSIYRQAVPQRLFIYRQAKANAGEDQLHDELGGTIRLSGSNTLGNDATYCWRQIGGPEVSLRLPAAPWQLPSKIPFEHEGSCRAPDCAGKECEFVPERPGVYSFQVDATENGYTVSANVQHVVAPPPEARALHPYLRAHPGYLLQLDGSASRDAIDPEPTFEWRIVQYQSDTHENCNLSRNPWMLPRPSPEQKEVGIDNTAAIYEPNSRRPTFVANDYGRYCIVLTVGAKRNIAGREIVISDPWPVTVDVERSKLRLFARVETQQALTNDVVLANLVFSPSVGVDVFPWTNVGFEATQYVFMASMDPRGSRTAGLSDLGGGTRLSTVVSLGALPEWLALHALRAEVYAQAGLFFRAYDDQVIAGPTVGVTFSWRLVEQLSIDFAFGVNSARSFVSDTNYASFYGGTGLTYE
ncbi:MAG TPA: hypothetical protein VGG39_21080 [Polyangiaceae bacterium]